MPTTKMPVCMRSEYVTIGQPPFHKIRGQEAAPCLGGQPPTVTGSARYNHSIPVEKTQ